MNITGSCHCGTIKFTATVNPKKVVLCHCTDCQVMAGSAFRTVVMSDANSMIFTQGKAKEYIKVAESGNKRAQGFCADCGTALYATSVGDGDKVYGIRIGCVEQREELPPQFQIWCRSSPTWLSNIHSLTSFEQGPTA